MLKTILGSAIGGLMAGAVALGVSAFAHSAPAPVMSADPNNPYAMTVAYTGVPGQGAAVVMARPAYYAPTVICSRHRLHAGAARTHGGAARGGA